MKEKTKVLLKEVSRPIDQSAAYNIREDCGCAGRQSTENITIENKEDQSGINIYVKAHSKKEMVFIPALITKSNVDDLVYNDFFIGENAEVMVFAGCGVHTDSCGKSEHKGIHRFFLGKNSKVKYFEKHIGTKNDTGRIEINPQTYIELEEGSTLEMDTTQISGVDYTDRKTWGTVGKNATFIVKEHLLTEGEQIAKTDFNIDLDGEDAKITLTSRSVAKDESHQEYRSIVNGNTRCTGHTECDAIIVGNGTVSASPDLVANDANAMLIHEAAIGKIAGEQLLKLQTLGLTEEEAENTIINGFLK